MDGRFEREWLRGSLEMLVLAALADEAQYGYAVQAAIERSSEGRVRLPAGTLYPLLHRLESDGLIRSSWEDATGRRRKWYALTAKGRRSLAAQKAEWEAYTHCVSRVLKLQLRPSTS